MIRFFAVLNLFLACSVFANTNYKVNVATDREDALYKIGETVVFTIELLADDKPVDNAVLSYAIKRDGSATDLYSYGTLNYAGKPMTVSGDLQDAGFLRCEVTYQPQGQNYVLAMAAGGVEPEKIKPGFPEAPADFDEFWNKKKAELACLPINPKLVSVPVSDSSLEAYDVKLNCIGMPVSGYYVRPKNAKRKSLPAILFTQGAGVYSSGIERPTDYAKDGFIAMEINAHGIINGQPVEFYQNLWKDNLKGYPFWGRESRETSYFVGMYLRLIRALDFLKSQPEWDGKILITYGGSQGGGQAIAAAGLVPEVSAFVAQMPAMCDHSGKINGWPWIVPTEADGSYNKQILQATRYVDAVNFARKTKARAFFDVGFIDNTCRPTSVYAAYNSLTGEKEMLNEPTLGHEFPAWIDDIFKKKIKAYINGIKK